MSMEKIAEVFIILNTAFMVLCTLISAVVLFLLFIIVQVNIGTGEPGGQGISFFFAVLIGMSFLYPVLFISYCFTHKRLFATYGRVRSSVIGFVLVLLYYLVLLGSIIF